MNITRQRFPRLWKLWDVLRFSVQHPLLLSATTIAVVAKTNFWIKLLLLPCAYFLVAMIGIVIGVVQKDRMLRQLRKILLDLLPDYEFVKLPIDSEFSSEEALSITLDPLRGERPGSSRLGRPTGWAVYFRRVTGFRFPPSAFQAFPITGAPFYIIMADRPSDMTNVQVFRLLHEIGHLTLPHLFVKEAVYTALLEYSSLLLLLIALSGFAPVVIAVIPVALIIWLLSSHHSPIVFEELADAYAVLHMVVHPTFHDTIIEYKLELQDELKGNPRYSKSLIERRLANIDRTAQEANAEGEHPHSRFSFRTETLLPHGGVFVIIGVLLVVVSVRVTKLSWLQLVWLAIGFLMPLLVTWRIFCRRIDLLEDQVNGILIDGAKVSC